MLAALGSKVTHGTAVRGNVLYRDAGLGGPVAVVKTATREAGCGENCEERVTVKEAEKQMSPTRGKDGRNPKTRKKEPQRGGKHLRRNMDSK
jgi:hypothetical protein